MKPIKNLKKLSIHTFNNENLTYKKVSSFWFIFPMIVTIVATFFIGLLTGTKLFYEENVRLENQLSTYQEPQYKGDVTPIENEVWKDSIFTDYAIRAQLYLDRPENQGTPLNGEMMALAARNAYDSTGNFLPVELALSQAVWESSLGRKGRSPINNPWNIGEYDSGTVMWFESTFDGTQAYYYWMCRTYLECRTVEELLVNFVNCGGHRYAKQGYEQKIHSSYINIKNWIDANIKH